MQLLVALSVLVALFYYNAASVIKDANDVDLDSSTSRKGYPLYNAKQSNGYDVDSLSGYENVSSRIIGGHTVRNSKATPWIAAIYRKGSFYCTGVLIHVHWVLTAAHCVTDVDVDEKCDDKYKKIPAEDLRVVIGDVDLKRKTSIGVTEVEYHKDFDDGCRAKEYDFGLLKLKIMQPSNRIICISSSRGPYGYQFGFGMTRYKSPASSVLKYYEVKLVSDEDCEDAWNYNYLPISNICHEGRDKSERSCLGDSGGPLVTWSLGRAELIAVQSYGYSGCRLGRPKVAARLKYGRAWIQDAVGSYKSC